MNGVLRRFPAAVYNMYTAPKTLVRPCSSKKLHIYGSKTNLFLFYIKKNNVFDAFTKIFITNRYLFKKKG